jgi:hypothetical protein
MSMTPGDTDGIGDRLRAERPHLDAEGETRVREAVAGRFPDRPRTSRRPMLGVAALLAAGLVLTGGGAAAAISGLAADTTAVNAQYSTPVQPGPVVTGQSVPNPAVGGAGAVDTTPTKTSTSPTIGSLGESDDQPPSAQAPNQVVAAADSGDTLPFTGFAAIPIIVIGGMLIAAGALLRRRTRPTDR